MVLESGFEMVEGTPLADVNYSDDNIVFPINNRLVNVGEYFIVKGDNNSEIISFEQERYIEGIDMATKTIEIVYQRDDGAKGSFSCVNVRCSIDKLRFSWVIDSLASAIAGELKFIVRFYGNNYSAKTQNASLSIRDALTTELSPEIPTYGEVLYLTPNEVNEIMLEVKTQIASYGGNNGQV